MRRSSPLFLSLALSACANAPAAMQFTDADRAAIAGVTDEAIALANAGGDWAQPYAERYYTEDAWVFMDGAPTIKGLPAIVEWLKPFDMISNWKAEHLRVEGEGRFAYVAGRATFEVPGEDGAPVIESYRYVEVWRRQADGSWKVVQDISNREVPPPPAQP